MNLFETQLYNKKIIIHLKKNFMFYTSTATFKFDLLTLLLNICYD
jgi:hypothetical protein